MLQAKIEAALRRSRPNFANMGFEAFAEQYLTIQNKNGELVPFRLNRMQKHILETMTGYDLYLKFRQGGVSTFLQGMHIYNILQGNARILTLCHEDDLTQELRDMADRFYENLPPGTQPRRKYANAKVTTYPDTNSRARIATVGGHASSGSAGKKKGRGGTNTHFHGSEVAFWPDAKGVMSAAMQAGNPAIALESTPNGAQGWFYERCIEALAGRGRWALHFYAWWWDDAYCIPLEPGETLTYTEEEQRLVDKHHLTPEQIKWRRVKQGDLRETFAQEYPEDPVTCFLNSGNTVFGAFENRLYTPEPNEAYNPEHRYFGGVDWGQANDYTAVSIKDATDNREVALLRINQMQWSDMRREIVKLCKYWHVEKLVVELNSASSNFEALRNELEASGLDISTQGVHMSNPFKGELVVNFYEAVHTDGYRLIDDPAATADMRGFISKQTATGVWQYETPQPGHDDTVIARMLANYAAFNRIPDNW